MGMSASQGRFLQLTSRKHTIGLKLTELSNNKVSLARDMQRISREYQNALCEKTLKWSNNQGVNYIDLSYNNLMKPSVMNQNKPYVLTDSAGKVVLDREYRQYAEMISPTGAPGGDWDSVREQVLASILGISPEDLTKEIEAKKNVHEAEAKVNDLIEHEVKLPTKDGDMEKFLSNVGYKNIYGSLTFAKESSDWAQAYDKEDYIKLGNSSSAYSNFEGILKGLKETILPYFNEEDQKAIEAGYKDLLLQAETILDGNDSDNEKTKLEGETFTFGGNKNNYTVKIKELLDALFATVSSCQTNSGKRCYEWYDRNKSNFEEVVKKREEWEANLETAKEEYTDALRTRDQIFTGDQESLINFYDTIFSSIAEKGWTYNSNVNDNEYLNQMLQNNMYTMTTVERESSYDYEAKSISWENTYEMSIASNFSKIFFVNDTDTREQALVDYEYQKSIISAKESRIDTRMKDLETEQSAINQMLQGLEKVRNENIERTMNTMA